MPIVVEEIINTGTESVSENGNIVFTNSYGAVVLSPDDAGVVTVITK